MKRKLLLLSSLISLSFSINAQNSGKTYAITGKLNNSFYWADIKQVDIANGKVVKTLFEADKTVYKINNTDKSADALSTRINYLNPTGMGVAACALDPFHNRLYFAPLHFSDISYLDLNKEFATFTTIKTSVIAKPAKEAFQSEENQITRMVIAADGYGYALSNDANHLIRFTTDINPLVKDLGPVSDATSNNGISIHNKCTSWGGDMVADAFGKIVVVSANHIVFTIDVNTKTATINGTITGLPGNFTTNGAAVDEDGFMVVSSANIFDALYKVNMKDLSAKKIVSAEKPFNASDLANGNFLLQKEADIAHRLLSAKISTPLLTISDAKIFPNPVNGSTFQVLFTDLKKGNYTVVLTDLAGRAIQSKIIPVLSSNQTASISLINKQAKGTYIVNVYGENKLKAFTEKVIID